MLAVDAPPRRRGYRDERIVRTRGRGAMKGGRSVVTRLRDLPHWVPDGLLALCLAALHLWGLLAVAAEPSAGGTGGLTLPAVAGLALSNLPLVARRRRPGLVLTIIGLTLVASAALALPTPGYGLLVAVYTYAAWRSSERAGGTVLTVVVFTAFALYLADAVRLLPLNAVILLTAWVLGDRQRAQRLETAELEQRAAALQAERAAAAALAIARERARIAGELHDVVAHGVMAMVAQASAAERLMPTAPERATAALSDAEATGRTSLADVRRLLGLLREDAA